MTRNERNVKALMQAIIDAAEREDYISIFPEHFKAPEGTDIERLAERLARMGVLVPSALTDQETEKVAASAPHRQVERLERIARGEG